MHACLARREHGAMRRLFHVLEQLRLGRACNARAISTNTSECIINTWVAKQQHVDVTTNTMLLLRVLSHVSRAIVPYDLTFANLGLAAEHGKSQGSLDVLVAVDGWSNALDDTLANTLIPSLLANLLDILVRQPVLHHCQSGMAYHPLSHLTVLYLSARFTI